MQAGLEGSGVHAGSVTLIQRFGSAANLNIHLHCLVLDGVYRSTRSHPSSKLFGARLNFLNVRSGCAP